METLNTSSSQILNSHQGWFSFITEPFLIITRRFTQELHSLEQFYIKLHNIYSFTSQMTFFILCAVTFDDFEIDLDKNEKVVLQALKTLLFYSVFTYFVAKSRDVWSSSSTRFLRNNWNFFENLCRIAIEWAKAIVVVLCLKEQGINFKPNAAYATITFIYYLCTEKIFTELLQTILAAFNWEIFENLEHLYVPLFLNVYVLTIGSLIVIYLLTSEYSTFAVIASYVLIYIRLKDIYYNYWQLIILEKRTYNSFRSATDKDLEEYDDICAVCLNKMSRAKITPCNHYFHPTCLKECLKNSFLCPICKEELTINI